MQVIRKGVGIGLYPMLPLSAEHDVHKVHLWWKPALSVAMSSARLAGEVSVPLEARFRTSTTVPTVWSQQYEYL